MSIFRRNSIKRTKSNSYRKHFYNCIKMVHVGLHSVRTYHKKFGWENKKNKKKLCRVSKNGTPHSLLYRVSDVKHSTKKLLCRVPKLGARQCESSRPLVDVLVVNDNCLWANDFWRNKNAGLDHIEQEILEIHTHSLWIK
jgi:hypothetical protein